MDWLRHARAARLVAAALAVVTITGCPELNQWSGPSQDPFFSVDDERWSTGDASLAAGDHEPPEPNEIRSPGWRPVRR
jgi:hypothetical protein